MNFTIRAENFDLTDPIRNYTKEKVTKIERYFDENVTALAHVNLKIYNKGNQKAEVTIPLSGLTLRAESTERDIYAAIDTVVDKLERQIRKYKTKINRKSREKGFAHTTILDVHSTTLNDTEEDNEEVTFKRKKHFELDLMSPEEAVLQMDLLGHDFFLFMDGESGKTCAVYRRNEASYGIIETN